MKKKINNLDAYRVIVTLLIVIGHSMYLNITQTTGGVSYTLNTLTSPVYYNTFFTLFNYLIILISKVHIQLFFVLSGILIYKVLEKYSIDEYIINRFKRLIIPYLLCGLLYMIPIKSLTGFYSDIFLSYKSFLSGFDGGHLWFLPALFWMSIILFIIAKKITSKNSYFVLIICILIQFFSQNIPGELFYLKFGLSYMGYIGFGFLFSHIIKDKKISKMNYLLITTIGLLFLLIYVLFKFIPDYLFPICMFILIYGFSSLIYNTKICNNSIFRILLANSFYIYLFHDPLNYIILKIVFKYNLLKYSCGPYLYLFSRTILVIIVSIILGIIVENIFLKKIKKMLTK